MDNLSTLALQLAADLPALHGSRLAVARVRDVKIRAFTAPGQALELEAHAAVGVGRRRAAEARRARRRPDDRHARASRSSGASA